MWIETAALRHAQLDAIPGHLRLARPDLAANPGDRALVVELELP